MLIRTDTIISYLFICTISFNNKLRIDDVIVKNTVIKYTIILTSLFKDNQFQILLFLILMLNQDNTEKINKNDKTGKKQL